MTTPKEDLKAFTARFPEILYLRMKGEVERRRVAGEAKLSIQDWVIEAAREKLEEPESAKISEKISVSNSGPRMGKTRGAETAAEIAARFGIKTGATIEEVEPRLLGPEFVNQGLTCEAESKPAQVGNRLIEPDQVITDEEINRIEFAKEFGSAALKTMLRMPAYMKLSWPKRFELAREQREREVGS